MKRVILRSLLVIAMVAPGVMKAQYTIPNGSFESWTGNLPDNWVLVSGTIQKLSSVSYTKTTLEGQDTIKTSVVRPAKDGNTCIAIANQVVGTNAYYGIIKDSFAFTGKPNFFSMNYAYFGLTTEQAVVVLFMSKWNTTLNKRDTVLLVNVPTVPGFIEPWNTLLNADLSSFYKTGSPDTCRIIIVNTHAQQTTPTTTVIVDNLFFTDNAPAGIEGTVYDNATAIHAYPNPFTGKTNIHYNLTENGQVSLKVYDMSGKEISTLIDGNEIKGGHDVNFDAEGLKNGVYFYRLQSGSSNETGKLILNK